MCSIVCRETDSVCCFLARMADGTPNAVFIGPMMEPKVCCPTVWSPNRDRTPLPAALVSRTTRYDTLCGARSDWAKRKGRANYGRPLKSGPERIHLRRIIQKSTLEV
jgi:hypothetical protein